MHKKKIVTESFKTGGKYSAQLQETVWLNNDPPIYATMFLSLKGIMTYKSYK